MPKKTVKKVLHHHKKASPARKSSLLFSNRNDWFLWVVGTVFVCLSVFALFGLLPV